MSQAQETGDAPQPVPALPAVVEGAKSYTPADFARFAPKTAMDMLGQVPGFVVRVTAQERGLGQASTNVLLNGERFSGKSNDVVAELGRISAADVVRIDIIDGATLNVPGLSGEVANIHYTRRNTLSGQFRWNPQIRAKRTPASITNGNASLSGAIGKVDFTLGFDNQSRVNGNAGPEIVTDRDGNVIDRRDERIDVFVEQPKISLGLKHKSASGALANLNASYQIFNLDADETSFRSGPNQVDRDRRFFEKEREYNYEIGGDYEFAIGPGRLKMIGLHRFEHSPYSQTVITRYADDRAPTGQRFEQKADEGESILRAEYGWSAGKSDLQVAAEGAYNYLDNVSSLFLLDANGVFQPQSLDNAVARVEEKRAEASATLTRPLSSKLTLQASLGGEYSKLSQTGANGLSRAFYRPKGFVSLAWKPSPRLDISAKVAREVGQLNFYDFVAFVNVGSETGNAGNPEIVPQQSWLGEVSATRNFGAYGTVTARFYGRLYQDIFDYVPIGDDGQAPGNLDKATLIGTSWTGTLNLDPFGLKGAKIDLSGQFQHSRIEDPLTGIHRPINDTMSRSIEISFRHDVPGTDWAYGSYYNEFEHQWQYRLNEKSRPSNDPGGVGIFVENKDVLGLTIRGSVDNLLGTQEQFTRIVHDGRRTDPVLFTEFRDRDYGPIFTLSISGKF
ncbi:TonB-dependent receptor [Allosphingosinicella flava]|uniref:TonB-dependent receptor n=1 Tax=Allosphingosinicella flava TaxID=2771430 RepID=A0A7T2GII5_9SPHN|nr:TonB-dependent receptor [Sphingosinicella flava]QPQ54492.1 TonB-dependent receptor [Sphingosinicella flava]